MGRAVGLRGQVRSMRLIEIRVLYLVLLLVSSVELSSDG